MFQRTITRIHKMDEAERFLLKRRIALSQYVVMILLLILASRLWYLQILNGKDFRERSNSNRTKTISTIAPRGNILDRTGRLLVTNRPCFNVVWLRPDRKDSHRVLKRLASILEVETSSLIDKIREASDQSRYLPVTLASDIDWQTLVSIENNHLDLPGVKIQVVPRRSYADPDLGFHLLGYLGKVSLNELKRYAGIYDGDDMIGKTGIEQMLENDLRGEKGHTIMEIDSRGFLKKEVEVVKSLPGRDVYLTIDAGLQKTAEKALDGNPGAVVAMEVNTGRVLVLASSPSCDLERFASGLSDVEWATLTRHSPLKPLLNRATKGKYFPGSTFKVVTALAALYEGIITPSTKVQCNGAIRFGDRPFRCWKHSGHGLVDLKKALAQSCDVYFYTIAEKLDIDTLAKFARALGLGSLTNIGLGESPGLIGDRAWKIRVKKEPWHKGETLNMAIGQGFNSATPLQICRLYAAIANGGILYRPMLVERVVDPDGRTVRDFTPQPDGRFDDYSDMLPVIRDALVAAVNEEHGTGTRAALDEVIVAGKTGTSQVVHTERYEGMKEEDIPRNERDHAWFACFAPADKPEIAVAVLVENGGHGGSAAAPIARKVLEKYFAGQKPSAAEAD